METVELLRLNCSYKGMDPGTGLTILGTAVGSAKIVEKILGPTASYLGDGLKGWVEQRVNNVSEIFKSADRKIEGEENATLADPPAVGIGVGSRDSRFIGLRGKPGIERLVVRWQGLYGIIESARRSTGAERMTGAERIRGVEKEARSTMT